ncbi:protein transport protein Sec31A-like isoform X1 [Oncorhynchus kisutch]|uniref:protein transport protein Sec31A-like isoform X1 n=2 Tax=Oncorhynchus kisutch TaxID=8019 RepID=UPI0012DD0061|nr:protein transport protein Sec31A-like isoform X1 [Oncorhynchus kisutch]
MRLKEIQRTAHPAWSPAPHHPICLALGTSAQQLDASFNTTAALEIFQVDFADPSLGMKLKGSLPTSNRLHSLVWVNFGAGEDGLGGRLIGGSDNGTVTVYSPEAIVTSGAEAIIGQSDKHTGPVRALDFNPFQSNLLASGANDSEIYIWDLNNFSNPMTPGTKSQLCEPPEDISVVSWNRQVQHILASANPSGKAVVWDLRKNEPIIKISDHSNRMHCSGMLWHPEVATQLVLASEDDRMPVIQMWDLRFATSPLKVLENHTRGLLSIAWSQADPELLLSSAKDNRILCWNPNTGEVIYELPTTNQWCFDIQWCPRNPALLSAASFDGWISVYSVMGGSLEAQQQSRADQISSSFDTMDPFGTGQVLPPLQVPQPTPQTTLVAPLKKPPKWVRRPVGASFAFGGKLITFESPKAPVQSPQPVPVPRQVFVSQVTTETELLQRSRELQAALQSGSLSDYCQAKIHKAPTDSEQDIWRFLLVNFEDEARVKFLRLLGFSKEDLERKISTCLGKNLQPNGHGVDANDLAEKIQLLSTQRSEESGDEVDSTKTPGSSSPSDFFSQIPPQPQDKEKKISFPIPVSADADGLISQALLVGNFEGAVDLCLNEGRYAEAILLAISGGQELLQKTQQTYLDEQRNSISMLISSVVTQNWGDIVQSCALENWKEALAALLTYAHPKEFAHLCETLGSRLEGERTEKRCLQACLCYICSGNIEKLVECWALQRDCSSPLVLEDLVEKMMVLRKSVERLRNSEVAVQSPILADKLTHYAGLLASQGSLATALSYLPDTSDQACIMMMRDRLFHAQGEGGAAGGQQPPPFPYNRVRVTGGDPAPAQAPAAPVQAQPPTQTPGPYQPPLPVMSVGGQPPPPVMSVVGQPPMTTVFTPQAAALSRGPPPPSYGGLPPSSPAPPPSGLPRTGLRPAYPQHPATAPGFSPLQPFQPQQHPMSAGLGGPGLSAFPPGPAMPGSSLSGPPLPPFSAPGGLPTMPSPGPPPSGFTPTSLPSGPMPPSYQQPGAPVGMYPPGGSHLHSQGPPAGPPSGPYPPLGPGYPQGGPGAPAVKSFSAPSVAPPPTGYFPWLSTPLVDDDEGQDGWNDPPAVRGGSRKKKVVPDNYTPPAPITAPVMGGFPMEGHHHQPQGQQGHDPSHTQQFPPGAPQEPNVQLLQALPAERVEQREIPTEHMVLKQTFDSLVQRCQLAAQDPQTKRKLEDASKRLGYLYDKLREQTLSNNILGGLHEISRCVAGQNYQRGLEVHTAVVTSSNFSEIQAFMPILKVVMTIANKLGV